MEPIVLLVDDDENLLRGLARALRQQPYRLHTARSAEEAVWVLKTHPVDLIVADERMPGMSGGDLWAWITRHYPAVMRIVLTGHATTEAAIRAINEGGVYHFFTKPCNVVHLAVTIRKALEYKLLLDERRRTSQAGVDEAVAQAGLSTLKELDRTISGRLCSALAQLQDRSRGMPAEQMPDWEDCLRESLLAAVEAQQLVRGLLAASSARVEAALTCGRLFDRAPVA